jgi:hypothetical protein
MVFQGWKVLRVCEERKAVKVHLVHLDFLGYQEVQVIVAYLAQMEFLDHKASLEILVLQEFPVQEEVTQASTLQDTVRRPLCRRVPQEPS